MELGVLLKHGHALDHALDLGVVAVVFVRFSKLDFVYALFEEKFVVEVLLRFLLKLQLFGLHVHYLLDGLFFSQS